jgi:hypothetical protein
VWVETLLRAFSGSAQNVTLKTYFSHPSLSYFYPNPPIKLKLELHINGRLLIATQLDQSIYLANHKQGVIDKNDLRVFRERANITSHSSIGYMSILEI